jgi:hypothetical protein
MRMRFEPQDACRNGRIYPYLPPPSSFVAKAMHLAMMSTTQGDGELITDLPAQCAALGKPKVMSI